MYNIYTYAYFNVHTHIYNTYIKIHPYVVVEYLYDGMNLVIIGINETYQIING
jgi:hypothetical protein